MVIRRWGILLVTAGWLAGIALGAGRDLVPWRATLIVGGAAVLVLALTSAGIAGYRYRRTLTPLSVRWQLALVVLWSAVALLLGLARFAASLPGDDPRAVANLADGSAITLRGVVAVAPDVRDHGAYLQIDITQAVSGFSQRPMTGVVEVFDAQGTSAFAPEYGDFVQVSGTVAPVPPLAPPGIAKVLRSPKLRILGHGFGNPLLATIAAWRLDLAHAIERNLPAPEAALLIGLLLGMKTPVLRQRLALFTRTGTIHLVVPSGLKVTLIGGLVGGLVGRLGLALRLAVPLAAIALYTFLSGAGPAALRAAVMGTILVVARATRRDYDALIALASAAILLTLWEPTLLWDVGFHLSAAGTLGLITLNPPVLAWLKRRFARVPFGVILAEEIATTITAQIGTFPLTAINFGLVSLIAPLANLLLVPALPLFLALGTLVGVVGNVLPVTGEVLGAIAWPLLRLADLVVEGLAAPDWAALTIGTLPGWITPVWVAAVGIVPLAWAMRHPPAPATTHHAPGLPALLRGASVGAVILALFAVTIGSTHMAPAPPLRITFMDLPGGPATLIQSSAGPVALVDGGTDGPALLQALAARLPFWERRLDLVILTDARPAHLDGLPALLNSYQIGEVIDAGVLHPSPNYASWFSLLQRANVPLVRLAQGTTIALGEARLTIRAPTGPLLDGTDQVDENALIFRLDAPGLRALFVGEAGDHALAQLFADLSPVDLVQFCAPTTPDRQAIQTDLLRAMQAQLAIMMPGGATLPEGIVLPTLDPVTDELPPILTTRAIGNVSVVATAGRWWVAGANG